jgi:hypothetical protein
VTHAPKTITAFVVILLIPAFVSAAPLPKTATLLGPETVVLLDIEDFNSLQRQFEKTDFYKLYKDPAMAAFVEYARAKWNEKTAQFEDEITRTILQAGIMPQGRLAVALVPDPTAADANEPAPLLISQWGENVGKIKEALDKTIEKAISSGSYRKTEEYRGVNIVTIITELPPQQVPDWSNVSSSDANRPTMKTIQPPPDKVSFCFIDDTLLGAAGLETLKFVVARLKGAQSPSLAADPDYTAVNAATGPYHDIDLYVGIKQFIKIELAGDSTGKVRDTLSKLGIDNVSAFGMSFAVARSPQSSWSGKAHLRINGPKKGLLKILETQSSLISAPRFVSDSAYSVTFFNFSIKNAVEELANFFPAYATLMNMPLPSSAADPQQTIKLKSDVIDHLGSQIVIAQSAKKPFSETAVPTESLVALAVNNRAMLEKSISTLYQNLGPDNSRELLGHTIYTVTFPGMNFFGGGLKPMQESEANEQPSDQQPKLAFTITDTYMIFAEESVVERAVRMLAVSGSASASLDSAKWFTAAKSVVPSSVGLAYLENSALSSEIFWWMFKQAGKSSALGMPTAPNPAMVFSQMGFDLFKFDLLPDFAEVKKYFGLGVSYGQSRPDGFFFEFKYLKAPDTE